MIPFSLQEEPASFHDECRTPGKKWLAEHSDSARPKDFWSRFEPELRQAFRGLCAWCAMEVIRGQADHFLPVAKIRAMNRQELAYEWSNLRYVDAWINQKKHASQVLDPFAVQHGWFKVILPSLQLLPTDEIPGEFRELAQFTLERLGLRDHEVIVRYRRAWFERYQRREVTIEALRQVAPLIADAVERDLNAGIDWRSQL